MKRIFIFLFCFLLLFYFLELSFSKTRKKKSVRKVAAPTFNCVKDSLLADGLKYKQYLYSAYKNNIYINVLEMDIDNNNLECDILKAKNNISETAKIREIINNHDSIDNHKTIAAINGNFWRAYSNYPIGALFSNNKIIELKPYKEWSSIFFDKNKIPYINNFKLSCKVYFPDNTSFYISDFNKRKDSNSIVIYNNYAGNVIPYVNNRDINQIYNQLLIEQAILETFEDSTENAINLDELKLSIIEQHRESMFESKLMKIKLQLIGDMLINSTTTAVVQSIDTGVVEINDNQLVLSYGLLYPDYNFPKIGDTLKFEIKSNLNQNVKFSDGITGTPRLVRNGNAKHEAQLEGSRSKRFINGKLARTAIGYNKEKTKLYLATVSKYKNLKYSQGASLEEMATLMKKIGCSDAINLDGGGSTMMVINNENIVNPLSTDLMRKISTIIAIRIK